MDLSKNNMKSEIVTFSVLGLFNILNEAKKLIFIIVSIVAIITSVYVYSMPDIYRAEITLIPTDTSNAGGISSLTGQLGGLAGLSGINLGAEKNNVAQFVELATSRSYIQSFIEKQELLPYLFAVKSWDKNSNKFIYDDNIYNVSMNKWLVGDALLTIPTPWQGYNGFIKMLSINEVSSSGMLKITLDYINPVLAKKWLKLYVDGLNNLIEQQDLNEAQQSIDYLLETAKDSHVQSVKAVLYSLIEEKTKTILLANVNSGYVLKPLTDIVLPEDKNSPNRVFLVIVITFLASIGAVFIALLRHLLVIERRHNAL